jgi:hypothetical protein
MDKALLKKLLNSLDSQLSSHEIADILWLSQFLGNHQLQEEVKDYLANLGDTSNEESEEKGDQSDQSNTLVRPEFIKPVKLQDTPSLRNSLAIARALRPLLRRVISKIPSLDEEATIQRITKSGIYLPVLRPSLESWLDVMMIVDKSNLGKTEQRQLIEFSQLLSCSGVFRHVQVWNLDVDNVGEFYLTQELVSNASNRTVLHPRELLDPAGRRLILLLSSCTASFWHDGLIMKPLEIWAQHSCLTIIQMLPELLWAQTPLGIKIPEEITSFHSVSSNRSFIMQKPSSLKQNDGVLKYDLVIPFITLGRESIKNWSSVIAGMGHAKTSGFVIKNTLDADKRNSIRKRTRILSEEERIGWFKITATPMERENAGL